MARWRTPQLSSAATNPGRDSALGAWQWHVPGQRSYMPWGLMISHDTSSQTMLVFAECALRLWFYCCPKVAGIFLRLHAGMLDPEKSRLFICARIWNPSGKLKKMFVGVQRNPPQKCCNMLQLLRVSDGIICTSISSQSSLSISDILNLYTLFKYHILPHWFGHYVLNIPVRRAHPWPRSAASFPSPVEVGAVPCHSKGKKCWGQGCTKCCQWKLLLTGRSDCLAFGPASSCLLQLWRWVEKIEHFESTSPLSPLLG